MRRFLLIVVVFIVYGSLYPFHFNFARAHGNPLIHLLHAWPLRIDRFLWRDVSVNVLLYFPLGLFAVLVLTRLWPRWAAAAVTVVLGAGLSASIEMLQIFDASRTCSLLDVASNVLGTVAGASVALTFRKEIFAIHLRRTRDRGGAAPLMLACCWMAYQLCPFIPLLGRWRLRAGIARFFATPVAPVELCASAAEWFAFALLLRGVTGRLRAPWLLLIMLCLPLRLLIAERTLDPAELLGAGLAILLWAWPAKGPRVRAGAVLVAAAIVLRELSPFAFTAPPHAMSWIPFAATLEGERLNAALVLFRKAFEYGAAVWLLRASGLRYRSAGVAVAGGLMLVETAQRYLPGRQPEVTDAVIAGLLAFVLWGSERRGRMVAEER